MLCSCYYFSFICFPNLDNLQHWGRPSFFFFCSLKLIWLIWCLECKVTQTLTKSGGEGGEQVRFVLRWRKKKKRRERERDAPCGVFFLRVFFFWGKRGGGWGEREQNAFASLCACLRDIDYREEVRRYIVFIFYFCLADVSFFFSFRTC